MLAPKGGGHGTEGLGPAESGFLDYFNQSNPKGTDDWRTFVGLFYKHLRRGTLSARFRMALRKSVFEGHNPPKSLAELVDCILFECANEDDLDTILALEAIHQKVSEKFSLGVTLKRFALRASQNVGAVSIESLQLLITITGSIETLFIKCIEVLGWVQGTPLLERLVELQQFARDDNNCTFPLESLCDLAKGGDDLLCFLSMYSGLKQVSLEQVLPAHDLLVRFGYPRSCLTPFVQLMERALLCSPSSTLFPIVNICSNAERVLASLHRFDSVTDRTERFLGVITSITGLCRHSNREVEKLLDTITKCLGTVNVEPDGLEAISALVCCSSQRHREVAKKLWLAACQMVLGNKLLIEKYLELLNSSSQPWHLLHPLLFSLFDIKLQFFRLYGRAALLSLSRVIHENERLGLQAIERGMAESICMHTLALINALGMGKPQYELYARENYQTVAFSMALILRYQINMKWKGIDRIASEFSPTASFYLNSPSCFPNLMLMEMYRVWADDKERLFFPELKGRYPDIILIMRLMLWLKFSLSNDSQLATQLSEEVMALPPPRQQAAMHVIRNGAISLIEHLQYQDNALALTRGRLHALRLVPWLCDSRIAQFLLQLPVARTNVHFLADLAGMHSIWQDQLLIDSFDAALFAVLREKHVPEFPLFDSLGPEIAIGVLRRLTAVVLSECLPFRLDEDDPYCLILEESMHLDRLVRGLIRACSPESFTKYAEELFSCCVEGCSVHILAMCAYVTIFSLEFHMLPRPILSTILRAIEAGGPPNTPTAYGRMAAICANLQHFGSTLVSSLFKTCFEQDNVQDALELANRSTDPTWRERWCRSRGASLHTIFFNHPLEHSLIR